MRGREVKLAASFFWYGEIVMEFSRQGNAITIRSAVNKGYLVRISSPRQARWAEDALCLMAIEKMATQCGKTVIGRKMIDLGLLLSCGKTGNSYVTDIILHLRNSLM